jgi:starch phosphorylase
MADFESYRQAHVSAYNAYQDKEHWNRMSLINIAASGHFAADRSIKEYADRIWHLKPLSGK